MPKLLPFPLPTLSLGTDLTSLPRIRSLVLRRPGLASRFARKILHPAELRDLERRVPHWQASLGQQKASPVEVDRLVSFLAGRWAAKEATRKAVGAHLLGQREVRVQAIESGGVQVVYPLVGGELEQVGLCSISHDGEYAVATVLAVPLEGERGGVKKEVEEG